MTINDKNPILTSAQIPDICPFHFTGLISHNENDMISQQKTNTKITPINAKIIVFISFNFSYFSL